MTMRSLHWMTALSAIAIGLSATLAHCSSDDSCTRLCQCKPSACEPTVPTDPALCREALSTFSCASDAASADVVVDALDADAGSTATVLVSDAGWVRGLAVMGSSLFWTTDTDWGDAGETGGGVFTCGVDGCGDAPTALATSQGRAVGIAVDSTNVYWSSLAGCGSSCGTIRKCALGGCAGAPTELASSQGVIESVAVDSTSIYWTDGNADAIRKCAIGGCGMSPSDLASSELGPYAIAVDSTNVYWTAQPNATVRACATGGSTPTTLATSSDVSLTAIAVDGSNVYWVTNAGTLLQCAASGCGGSPTTLATTGPGYVGAVVVRDGFVFWTRDDTNAVPQTYEIFRCPVTGCGASPTLLGSFQGAIRAMDADNGRVYFAASDNGALPPFVIRKLVVQ